ncbi:MAG: spore coat associated protein CotJA [Lachnospiraceae bacterium]|nr:spore coat associated protein CotJA [Lachnospiraceae bacterium]
MTQNYQDYYMAFGCQKQKYNEDCKCVKSRVEDACAMTPEDFCYEVLDCNDCVMEHVGLAQAYVPYQTEFKTFSQEDGLACGTIFPQLVIPYVPSRCLGRR